MLLATLPLLALAASTPVQGAYSLIRSYEGSTFFDRWSYYGNYDNLTNGDVIFVNQSASADLTYLNSAGNAIIKVDNTSTVPYNEKRNTVRIQSTDLYAVGSLWVLDAPSGRTLEILFHSFPPYYNQPKTRAYSAWWSQAPVWPAGGEIDTFEGVNLQTVNQMALHTTSGCENTATSASETGNLTYANCDSTVDDNNGCSVTDANPASYGAAFAAAGGGVWATQFAETGISIWFFSRADVPSDLLNSNTSAVPDPSAWGLPSAYYANSGCSISTHFEPQHLVLDITLCGDWAGNSAVFNETCTGVCYTDYVLNSASYSTAYFEIQSARVYCSTGSNCSTTATTGTGTSTSSSSAAGASSTGKTTTSGAGVVSGMVGGAILGLIGAVAVVAW